LGQKKKIAEGRKAGRTSKKNKLPPVPPSPRSGTTTVVLKLTEERAKGV